MSVTAPTLKKIGLLVVAAALVALLVDFDNFLDLRVYRAGGRAWLDGLALYSNDFVRESGVDLPFTYPPISAILFTSLAVVPWHVAIVVMTAVSLLALAIAAGIVRPSWVIPALALGIALDPVRQTLSFGQINLLLLVLVVADCLLPRTPWPRGLLIGIAAAIKLTPAAFVLFFVARRQWRPAVTTVAGFVAVTGIAWAAAPQDTRQYLDTVIGDPGRLGGLTYTGNQSLNGFWHRFGLPDIVTTSLWVASSLVVVSLAWRIVSRSTDNLTALVAVAAAGLLVSPVSWAHHWVWAIMAGLWAAPKLRSWPARLGAAVAFALFVAPPHWALPQRHNNELDWTWWQHIVGNDFMWCALALLVVLAVGSAGRRVTAARDVGRGGELPSSKPVPDV